MPTANIHDPASVEAIYPRAEFEREARLNAQDKVTVQHGVTILSTPDGSGTFTLVRASRDVGETADSPHSIFVAPSLETSEYGAFIQNDTDYGGPVKRRDAPKDPADPYRSFVEEILQAARSARFPPAAPADRLRGFHGG
ncbi:hypothetical protein [Azospirillum sp. sgz301742]